jgi:hypothetical protein
MYAPAAARIATQIEAVDYAGNAKAPCKTSSRIQAPLTLP